MGARRPSSRRSDRASSGALRALIDRANQQCAAGQVSEAIKDMEESLTRSPENVRLIERLAELHSQDGNASRACELLEMAIRLEPDNQVAQDRHMRALVELGRLSDAEAACRSLLDRFPRSVLARDVLGIVYLEQGQLEEALSITDELICLDPMDAVHHLKKAVILQQKGELVASMGCFLRALEMDPQSDLAEHARQAVAHLDGIQLKQIVMLAVEDPIFRARLLIDPVSASTERGFQLSMSGVAALRGLAIRSLPTSSEQRHYH